MKMIDETVSKIEKARRELEACDRLMEKLDAHMGLLEAVDEEMEPPNMMDLFVHDIFNRLHEIKIRENRSYKKRAIDIREQLLNVLAKSEQLFEEVENDSY